ncbi:MULTISPECIES: alanine dehydrogenase [Apibacter]|uniref:alanine dehydrogenase n=1 Tax=Apibacter TaxID=1778601 RepID=UPI001328EBB7|nr:MULTISPECIES: alanine dehydrogenase [Apibacter]MXO34149.1 alanine dehydrogenase [Apibacter sp. B3883]MXO41720.1 alanine dehydrogenase [Apibacter sp. B3889]MXP03290.1 alanine dehydrogenase [Apibacter sp. B3887]MXP07447.1 alanine dehydrogenase [Apibacter sp. B3935]QYN51266.1 alanine dehydrogenase [Apibacter sp. ESL0404]
MGIYTPFSEEELIPLEERIEVIKKGGKCSIGIPKEDHLIESRIALTPDAVSVLSSNGIEIIMESGAGLGAHYSDALYCEAGAKISYDPKEVLSQPIILKVEPLSIDQIKHLQPSSYLISAVQINTQCKEYFEELSKKKITALGFEYIRDSHNELSIVRLIGEIAGVSSILIAAELLSSTHGGNGLLLGGITGVRPSNVVIIGAGNVGESAARSALGLGATVKVFDNSLTRLRRFQELLGRRLYTSTIDPKELSKALIRCDVAIGCLKGELRAPIIVPENTVKRMKPGSVVIDISIDNGGVFETSEINAKNEAFIKHEVLHYCVPNITSKFARTASKALSNFFLSYFLNLNNQGGFEAMFRKNRGICQGIYMYKGRITNRQIASWYDLPYQDIHLLII